MSLCCTIKLPVCALRKKRRRETRANPFSLQKQTVKRLGASTHAKLSYPPPLYNKTKQQKKKSLRTDLNSSLKERGGMSGTSPRDRDHAEELTELQRTALMGIEATKQTLKEIAVRRRESERGGGILTFCMGHSGALEEAERFAR